MLAALLNHYLQAIELMVVDAFVKANDYLEISSHILEPREYWKVVLTDSSKRQLPLLKGPFIYC